MINIKSLIVLGTILFSCCAFTQAEAARTRCAVNAHYHEQQPVIVRPCYRPARVPVYTCPPQRVVVVQEPCYVEEVYIEERCPCHTVYHYTTYERPVRPVYRQPQPSVGFSFSWLFR